MTDEQINAELESYGVTDCACDTLVYPPSRPPCLVCDEEIKTDRVMSHIHFKGQLIHEYCLILALLRQLK